MMMIIIIMMIIIMMMMMMIVVLIRSVNFITYLSPSIYMYIFIQSNS